ncbi:MAG: RluA family pseudouridine synthase [Pseudomonadota bacterium]
MSRDGDEPGSATALARARTFVVEGAEAGQRLDAIVARRTGASVAAARRLVAAGLVRVDGRGASPKGARVVAGARVDIAPHADPSAPVVPQDDAAVVVVWKDAHLVAIDKPAGMPSHPLRAGERGTAANVIVARFPECARASPDPREGGLGHRLDTPTSGLLIAARSRAVWEGLRRALAAADCQKTYLCEVRGDPPDSGGIDSAIGRGGRRGTTVRVGGGGRRPLPAQTTWITVARRGRTALVEARLHAGRAHQVRAHLAAAGFPIVGDDRYGGGAGEHGKDNDGVHTAVAVAVTVTVTGHAPASLRLHAASVRLRHPVTGAALVLQAPPPGWAMVPSVL